MDRYNKALSDAEDIYGTVMDANATLLNNAHSAVLELLGDVPGGHDINGLLTTMSQAKRDKNTTAARTARDRLIQHAVAEKNKALEGDPFAAYIHNNLSNRVSSGYTRALLNNAPFTFASLRRLADQNDWCRDFESIAAEATREGVIPAEIRTVTREISGYHVPAKHSAEGNETWLAHLALPAYYRDTNRHGDSLPYVDLKDNAVSVTYEKKPDPEAASDNA